MKLCLRCNQYFEDGLINCPADTSELLAVGDNPLIGALINDRYVVDSVIGKGSSGIVYKATRLLMQREVAVKVLHSLLGAESGSLDRFLREARAAGRLKHPHIINIWESGVTDDGQPYFVMDYLEGMTLAELVKDKGALPFRRALPIVRQICEALGEAHRQSIVHRDIKPENIVLQESDYAKGEDFVKVLDFGIADQTTGEQEQGAPTRQRTAAGSPAYMSPEQCQGFQLDLRSDIYSLAIVVFELLTGTRPFEADDIMTLFRMHVKTPPPSLSQVRPDIKFPVKLEMAINKALSKDPAQRHQDVMAFCKDVEEGVESFQLDSISEDGYGTPGFDRDGKAISTLVLDANEDEAASADSLTGGSNGTPEPRFEDSWHQPVQQNPVISPLASGSNGGGGISSSSSTPQFNIPSKPQSPKAAVPKAEENPQAPETVQEEQLPDSEAASRLLESAKRASQSFKTNLSNSGKEDVSDWARQILQRKSAPNQQAVQAKTAAQTIPATDPPDNGLAAKTGSAFHRETKVEPAVAELQNDMAEVPAQMPRITPVPPLDSFSETAAQSPSTSSPQITPVSEPAPPAEPINETEKESEQHVSAWARQILKRGSGESSAKIPILKVPSDASESLLGQTSRKPFMAPKPSAPQAQPAAEPVSGESTEAAEQTFPQTAESREEAEIISDSERQLKEVASEVAASEVAAQEVEAPAAVSQDIAPAPPQNGTYASGAATHAAKISDEIGKQPAARGKMSIQDAIDAQRKETGKFSSKDVEAWGAMMKSAGSAKPPGATPDNVNVLHKIASTSNSPAAKTNQSSSNMPPAQLPPAPSTVTNRERFEQPVNKKVEPSTKFAKEVEKKLDAAIVKPGEHHHNIPAPPTPPATPSDAAKSGRIEADPNFDANRFEQPINRKAEKLNPFAREVEKKIDSAILQGRRAADDTGMMKSINLDVVAEAAKTKKEPATKPGSQSGPDLKKLLSRRRSDSSSPNLLGRAQEALKAGDQPKEDSEHSAEHPEGQLAERVDGRDSDDTSMSAETEEAHVISNSESLLPDAANLVAREEIVDVTTVEESKDIAADFAVDDATARRRAEAESRAEAEARAALAPFEAQPAPTEKKEYTLADLEAIGRGEPKAQPAKAPEQAAIVPPAPPEVAKPPIRLDKMRGVADSKASHPGFGDKLKSIFGDKGKDKETKSGMAPASKDKNTKSGMAPAGKDKNTKTGMAPADKDKNTKTGMPAAADKNTKSGMPAAKEKSGTKSGLAAIGAFFGGGKNKAADAKSPPAQSGPTAGSMDIAAAASTAAGFSTPQYEQPASFVSTFKPPAPEPSTPTPSFKPAAESMNAAPSGIPEIPLTPVFENKTSDATFPASAIPEKPLELTAAQPDATAAVAAAEAKEGEPNDFERAIAEALALEEARVKQEEEDAARVKAERAEREAQAAARAMAEIEAAEQSKAAAEQAEREAAIAREEQEAQAKAKAEQEALEAQEQARVAREAEEAAARAKADQEAQEAAARVRAEQEAQEAAARERSAQEAQEAAARARAEQEAQEAAARAKAEQEAQEAAARAKAEQEAKEAAARAEEEAKQAAIKAEQEAAARARADQEAAAVAAMAAMARSKQEAEAQAAAERDSAAAAMSPQIVDTPSKLGGKASQSQLAQMLNRFAKKGSGQADSGGTPAAPPPLQAPAQSMPAQNAAPMAQPMPAAAEIDEDPAAKSQKKFAELAQRLKSNAASRVSDAPAPAPTSNLQQPPVFGANMPQPTTPQGEFGGSAINPAAIAMGAGIGAFAGGVAQDMMSRGIDPGAVPFPEGRMDDSGNEPVKPEALNKKIEAVKKKIEALKAGGAIRPEPQVEPKVYDDSPKPLSTSSTNLAGGPPVNRLLEAAQRAVETGSVSRLPAQRVEPLTPSPEPNRFDPPQALPPKPVMPVEAPPPAIDPIALAAELEAKRKEAAKSAGTKDSYSSFRNIEQSVKSERTKGQKDVPDRARVRQSFNKRRQPIVLIAVSVAALVGGFFGFGPFMKALPQLQQTVQNQIAALTHQAPSKPEVAESADIDELIQANNLPRARALLDKSTKTNKWTQKDSERYLKIAVKYAESDPPEYESAIEVLNKIQRKQPLYRKAQKLAKNYASLKRKANSH